MDFITFNGEDYKITNLSAIFELKGFREVDIVALGRVKDLKKGKNRSIFVFPEDKDFIERFLNNETFRYNVINKARLMDEKLYSSFELIKDSKQFFFSSLTEFNFILEELKKEHSLHSTIRISSLTGAFIFDYLLSDSIEDMWYDMNLFE